MHLFICCYCKMTLFSPKISLDTNEGIYRILKSRDTLNGEIFYEAFLENSMVKSPFARKCMNIQTGLEMDEALQLIQLTGDSTSVQQSQDGSVGDSNEISSAMNIRELKALPRRKKKRLSYTKFLFRTFVFYFTII